MRPSPLPRHMIRGICKYIPPTLEGDSPLPRLCDSPSVCVVQMRPRPPHPHAPRGTGLGFPFFCLWNRVRCPFQEVV